jgi:hypothetical protein
MHRAYSRVPILGVENAAGRGDKTGRVLRSFASTPSEDRPKPRAVRTVFVRKGKLPKYTPHQEKGQTRRENAISPLRAVGSVLSHHRQWGVRGTGIPFMVRLGAAASKKRLAPHMWGPKVER